MQGLSKSGVQDQEHAWANCHSHSHFTVAASPTVPITTTSTTVCLGIRHIAIATRA
ncbi:predicted protein [Plenodomus lingam JN3]|uniref:Predicted protein n=2 Tax=Leptosphaeria maculans TaxID=5022 RepID=E5AF55_LEPMJ|nr:predicted protein [Plenodomus lingam JN3]CBY01844.1 predicted protein [Plenodomus lingam JN3]